MPPRRKRPSAFADFKRRWRDGERALRPTGAVLLGLAVMAIIACESGKWWREPRVARTTLVPDDAGWVWTDRGVTSAEGGIVFTVSTIRMPPSVNERSLPRPAWATSFERPGSAHHGRVLFPDNLNFEQRNFHANRPAPGQLSQTHSYFRIPWLPIIVALGALPTYRLLATARSSRFAAAGACPACGYDLRESPTRCPECGRSVEGHGTPLAPSQAPPAPPTPGAWRKTRKMDWV